MDITGLKDNQIVNSVKDAAEATGCEVFIIGGALRDIILGKDCVDFDFVVFGELESLTEKVAQLLGGPVIHLGSDEKEVHRIVSSENILDFTRAKDETLETDILKRDFTINALAYSIESGEVIDHCKARGDIDIGIICMVSDGSFDGDPLRMLRAFRFHADLGFTIADNTFSLISEKKGSIKQIAGERIKDELFKIFAQPCSHGTIEMMARCGILYEVFPELIDSVGCVQNEWHHLDVMEHTLLAYKCLEEILSGLGGYFPAVRDELSGFIEQDGLIEQLKYAMLLHDVAKPATKSVGDDGRVHFYRHCEEGEESAGGINKRLRLSKKDSAFVCGVIRHHLRIVPFLKLQDENRVTTKSILRYFMRLGYIGVYVILHNLADLMASRGIKRASESGVESVITLSNIMLDVYFNEYLLRKKNPPFITGKDLIDKFGLIPSPRFKVILDTVYKKQITSELTTFEEASEFVRHLLNL